MIFSSKTVNDLCSVDEIESMGLVSQPLPITLNVNDLMHNYLAYYYTGVFYQKYRQFVHPGSLAIRWTHKTRQVDSSSHTHNRVPALSRFQLSRNDKTADAWLISFVVAALVARLGKEHGEKLYKMHMRF